jgi:hypothetical protein
MGISNSDDFNLGLIQKADERQLQLAKMRAKLASQSLGLRMPPKPRQRLLEAAFTMPIPMGAASSWAWKIMLALSLIIGNGAYFFFSHEEKARLAVKRLPALRAPRPAMDVNMQALYWTYALYDFNKLVATFGMPSQSMVNTDIARAKLAELLPKTDPVTRLAIERYLPHTGRMP